MPIGGRGVTLQSIDLPLMSFATYRTWVNLVRHGGGASPFRPYAWEMQANNWSEISRRLLVPQNYASGILQFLISLDVASTTPEAISIMLVMNAIADGESTISNPSPTDESYLYGMTANIRYSLTFDGLTPAPDDLLQVVFQTNADTPDNDVLIYITAIRLTYLGF